MQTRFSPSTVDAKYSVARDALMEIIQLESAVVILLINLHLKPIKLSDDSAAASKVAQHTSKAKLRNLIDVCCDHLQNHETIANIKFQHVYPAVKSFSKIMKTFSVQKLGEITTIICNPYIS